MKNKVMMKRVYILLLLLPVLIVEACGQQKQGEENNSTNTDTTKTTNMEKKLIDIDTLSLAKIEKSEEEWKKELGDEQYQVARGKGTERAFTGEYWDNKKQGVYYCVACNLPLYSSGTKYKSGSGWPSFWAPIDKKLVATKGDSSHFMIRTELLCARCGAHLGHLFDDGPQPTGMRHCINSASLKFEENVEIKK